MIIHPIRNTLIKVNKQIIVGIDEAGRGPLAGPVVAASVIIPDGVVINGLNDSKKLTEKQRDALAPIIKEKTFWGIGFVDNITIDNINILNATFLAMERSVNVLKSKIELASAHFMIDGSLVPPFLKVQDTPLFDTSITAEAIVKGDSKIQEIMAASILAKTERDKFMRILATKYPEYGFERHKGYGTREHIGKIREVGVSPLHRLSFLHNLLV